MNMLLIPTGGTISADAYIDPDHPPHTGPSYNWRNAGLKDPVARFFGREDLFGKNIDAVTSIAPVPSLLIFNSTLQDIACKIEATNHSEIVIAHGTDTLAENARKLSAKLPAPLLRRLGKKVVLTGAMVPLLNDPFFGGAYTSDAVASLTYIAQHISMFGPGMHVVVSRKNDKEATFATEHFSHTDFPALQKIEHTHEPTRSYFSSRSSCHYLVDSQFG